MLLQTNSYVVPKEKRAEHARLLNKFRLTMTRLGCESFEVYEQAGSNWGSGEPSGRYVQLIKFRDKKHHQAVQAAERTDTAAQHLIAEFCELINFPYQQQQGLFAVGFYNSVMPVAPIRKDAVTSVAATPETAVNATTMNGAVNTVAAPVVAAVAPAAETESSLDTLIEVPPASNEADLDVSAEPDLAELDFDELDLADDSTEASGADADADHVDLDVATGRNGSAHGTKSGENGDASR